MGLVTHPGRPLGVEGSSRRKRGGGEKGEGSSGEVWNNRVIKSRGESAVKGEEKS